MAAGERTGGSRRGSARLSRVSWASCACRGWVSQTWRLGSGAFHTGSWEPSERLHCTTESSHGDLKNQLAASTSFMCGHFGACETLKTAIRLGIPTVLERPNAHTRFAYEIVQKECESIGVMLPPGHEHAYNADRLQKRGRGISPRYKTFVSLGIRSEDVP